LKFRKNILENRKSRNQDSYYGESDYEEGLLRSIQTSFDNAGYAEGEEIHKL
jgi:hypothetical protein